MRTVLVMFVGLFLICSTFSRPSPYIVSDISNGVKQNLNISQQRHELIQNISRMVHAKTEILVGPAIAKHDRLKPINHVIRLKCKLNHVVWFGLDKMTSTGMLREYNITKKHKYRVYISAVEWNGWELTKELNIENDGITDIEVPFVACISQIVPFQSQSTNCPNGECQRLFNFSK